MVVTVDREGTYGFRLVIHTSAGLSARPPQAGETADVWVHADWTRPEARLQSARYGTAENLGKLLIRWDAADEFLAPRPVSLAYAAQATGPWSAIATGLANTGQYAWRVNDSVPRQFYLKLEVHDRAGNVATDVLSSPISTDGLAPQGRIRSVRPLPADSSQDERDKSASLKNGVHRDSTSFQSR